MRIAIVAAVTLLTACCASNQPLIGQAEIATLEHEYAAARVIEIDRQLRCVIPGDPCELALDAVRRADYDAASAIVHAQGERTAGAVRDARKAVSEFAASAGGQ